MVTETAAGIVGLCLAPVQSLGSVKQLAVVVKKKKSWERNLEISTGTHKVPGNFYPWTPSWRCLSSFQPCPSKCVCWGAARAGLVRASLLAQLGSITCFTLGMWSISHHTCAKVIKTPAPSVLLVYPEESSKDFNMKIKPFPAVFVPAAGRPVLIKFSVVPQLSPVLLGLFCLHPCADHECQGCQLLLGQIWQPTRYEWAALEM